MTLNLKDKELIVAKVSKDLSTSSSVVTAEYRGLTANQINKLRKKAKLSNVSLRITRNNLAKLAVKGSKLEFMSDIFRGPLILAISKKEPRDAAKLFKEFMQSNKRLVVKNLVVDRTLLGPEKLEEIAKLPSYNESIVLLCNMVKASISQLTILTCKLPVQLLRVMSIIKKS